MTYYQELQLNQAGSKNVIRNSETRAEKIKHTLIYLSKIAITLAFCFSFVTVFSMIFGSANSVVGVVVLLSVMVFKNADFGVDSKQSVGLIALFFALMAVGPHLANTLGVLPGLLINAAAISLMIVLGCHIPQMCNHSTIVLGYLLLYGYDVSGEALVMRILGLGVGALMTAAVFYHKHHNRIYEKKISDVLRQLTADKERLKWQLSIILCVPVVVAIAEAFHMPRAMWAGIAAMSVISMAMEPMKKKVLQRILGNVAGVVVFLALYFLLPSSIYAYIGLIGGIGVGFSVNYGWQSLFNTFGALAIAAESFGLAGAIGLRLTQNIYGALFALFFCVIFFRFYSKWQEKRGEEDEDEVAYA